MKRHIKQFALRLHEVMLSIGICVIPKHYYSPVASLDDLKQTRQIWQKKSTLPGIDIDLDKQINLLRNICFPYQSEYKGNKIYLNAISQGAGLGYGFIEAQALHGVIRHYKPKRVMEVGSGVSTICTLAALELNKTEAGTPYEMTCIEPYPGNVLTEHPQIKLVPKMVQDVNVEVFRSLEEGDLLFIDSSHAVKPGSDVNYLFLEVLPILNDGVIVHVHDIYLPYDYQRNLMTTLFQWTETSLLRAFLINNAKAEILFCLSHLHYDKKNELREIFPEYDPQEDFDGLQDMKYLSFEGQKHFPSSIYFRIGSKELNP